jgi:hypothetical protein
MQYVSGCNRQLSIRGFIETSDEIQQGGFSASRRTHKGNERRRLDLKVQSVQRSDGNVAGLVIFRDIRRDD